ncbi:MAG: hypothetical protein IJU94_05535 [Clostridia bacterium]|nr:hypothetical protein [Clostridia bacterium]
MKKLMSTLIAACMLLSVLSGAVLFSGSAEAYETVKLVGFSNWTQTQLDTSSGNNGYANGCGSALYVETNAAYCVGGTTQAIKAVHGGGTAYNNCIVNWKYQTGGPCTDGSVWATADGESVSASDYEGVRIAVLNSKGEPAQFTRVIFRLTYGWNYSSSMRYWDGAPVSDDDGWIYFPFSEFQSSNGGGTDVYDYFDNLAKGISMLNYGGEDENTCYYSGVELYRTAGEVQKGSLLSAIAKLKGYDSVTYASEISAAEAVANDSSATQTQVDGQLLIINSCIDEYISNLYTDYAYVQLTGVQDWTTDDLASLTKYGSTYAISDKGLKGNATQSVEMTVKDNFARFCLASKTSSGFLAKNPFRFMDTSKGYKLSDFDGIAIAFNDADGNPLELSQFQVRLMRGQEDWNAYYNYEGNYYDTPLVYHDGYYHLYFKDYPKLAGDAINEISVISALFYKVLQVGDKAYFSDICAFKTDGLEEPEVDFHDVVKAKNDLNDLLNEADNLGMFESAYEHYGVVSDADYVYGDPNSTYDDYFVQSKIIRMLILAETAEEDLYSAFEACVNAWEYNYTASSYANLLEAIDDAWDICFSDSKAASDAEAIEILDAAYDKLVPVEFTTTTANFFEGWTDTQVNDVVDANSDRLCDSIGRGLNVDKEWNGGDFSNSTAFEANSNLSLTALADFNSKAMGWKNMDRSKTLQPESNGAFPPMNVEGLSQADGIRFKLEANGSVDRILIGLSNCSTMTREDYALFIRPEFADENGYINIPFSYFEKSFWTSEKFNKSNLDDVIVFIIECYGVKEDTTVTVSDLRGYKKLNKASADQFAKLAAVADNLEAFDVAGRYAELLAEARAIGSDAYESAVMDVYNRIFAVLETYKDPATAIVDVPGFSIYTQEELDMMDSLDGESSLTKTERGVIYNLPLKSGDYAFANGVYVPGTGFEDSHAKDPFYGKLLPINGKNFIDMLGGYKLTDIIAYRYQVEDANPDKGNAIHYSNAAGLWHGMLTVKHDVKPDADNWFTYYIDETPIDTGNWYYNDFDLQKVKEEATFAIFEIFDQRGKEMYNWQVILFESVDRSSLKAALERFAEVEVAGYADALDVYYNADATEAQIDAAAEALINSAKPKAPAAPELDKVTYNSVALKPAAKNIEFRCNDGEWTSTNLFEGLAADTEYSFYARIRESGVIPASDPSEALVVRTAKAPFSGEVGIEGEAVYGATLTASVAGIPDDAGELTYVWSRANALEAVQAGTGAEYVIGKADIGYTLSVAVTSAKYEGSIVSENTAEVIKATPVLTTAPAPVLLIVGESLGSVQLTGAEVSVEGAWAWVNPELVPDLAQSGSAFEAVFTPADEDCYLPLYAEVIVNISSNLEELTVTDEASGLSVTGEFIIGSEPVMTVAEIAPAQNAYINLLRAARNSESENNLVLFKNVSFDRQCFAGTLTLSAQLSAKKAGQEYTVWFFANGEVKSAQGVVDEFGVITVDGFVADVA